MGIDGSEIKRNQSRSSGQQARIKTKRNLTRCNTCHQSISCNASACPHCGEPLKTNKEAISNSGRTLNHGQIVAMTGALILALGTFAPIVSVPIAGTMNYFANGNGDGVVLLAFAAITVVFIFLNRPRILWFTGGASLVMMGYSFYEFKSRMNEITAGMEADLAGNPFRGFADMAMNSVQIQWGWGVLIFGAIIIISSTFFWGEE